MHIKKDDDVRALMPDDDVSGELRSPEYFVTFWKREVLDEPEFRFSTRKYRCTGAENVLEVISWAENNVQSGERCAVLFPVSWCNGQGEQRESMYLLYGSYPDGIEVVLFGGSAT